MASLSCKLPEKDKTIVLLINAIFFNICTEGNAIQGHNKYYITIRKILSTLSLLPCGHPDNTDAARSQVKINCRCLTEINSCNYGHSLMRTLTRGPYCVHYKGSWPYLEIIKKNNPWFFTPTSSRGQHSSSFNVKLYNRAVTKISSCQVYEISRKELNWQQVLLFLFPFVSHEST